MATDNKDFKIKNGLIVEGATATVNGNNVLTSASNLDDLANVSVPSPSSGQALVYSSGSWVASTISTGGGGGGGYIVSDTPPIGPSSGDIWFDSSTGASFIFYSDGDSEQWVEIGNLVSGPIGPTGPTGPGGTGPTGPTGPAGADAVSGASVSEAIAIAMVFG